MKRVGAVALLSCLAGCTGWLFSGESWLDRSRPVALVETTGGVELGATTEFGILTLGRTATAGPCRVHYFIGPTPLVETGELTAAGGVFTRATIDLKTQHLRVLDRPLRATDPLVAMWTPDGTTTRSVTVRLAAAAGVQGDVLDDPGEALPTGATVLCRAEDGGYQFVGLVTMRATLQLAAGAPATAYYGFAGVDRVREMLAVPSRHPVDQQPKYRTDDISVMRPLVPSEAPAPSAPATTPPVRQKEPPR